MPFSQDDKDQLKGKIIKTIASQGFYVNGKVHPIADSKSEIKNIHQESRKFQLLKYKKFLKSNLPLIKGNIISGKYLRPEKIDLQLIEIKRNSKEEKLYRWWNLVWWSMPYQRAYGRQMRFLIWDKYHNSPFGLIGLQSPVLKMAVRDQFLEIPNDELDIWVNRSMQAQRVGALPPYNELIGGKMVALALSSNQLRSAYREKYRNATTLLENRQIDPDLLFITTSSAYGRSSIYNRLKYNSDPVAIKLGSTKGFGTFHIPDDLFEDIKVFLASHNVNTQTTFGNGPSKRIKLLYQAFSKLDLPNYSQHRILREFYLFPHATNISEIINNNEQANYRDWEFDQLQDYWKERWCFGRSLRTNQWKEFEPSAIFNEVELL